VAVDRDDGDDAPDVDSAPDQGQEPPVAREQQVTEHARYRDAVQAAETRDAWARAAPALRAEWEAHKQRYPDRAERAGATLPDGSWAGDGGRRLSPEQNSEAAKCASDLRDEAIGRIGPAMDRIEAADPDRRLAGRNHMLKGEDRLKEKIAGELSAKPTASVRDALDKIGDSVRFTLEYPAERYAEGVLADIERVKAAGFELIKLKNLWHADQYKGVNSQWRAPETGTRCEIQFHTAESLEVKELTHEAYERIRIAVVSPVDQRDPDEERANKEFQRRASSMLQPPPGTDAICDFPRKEQTGG
jgi:hypothetical protein